MLKRTIIPYVIRAKYQKVENKRLKILYHFIIPLSIGIVIYALFRGIPFVDPVKMVFPILHIHMPSWVKYNLPDGLWFYSFISTITLIWDDVSSRNFRIWLIGIIILVFLSETFQHFHLVKGTFDSLDVFIYLIAIVIYAKSFKIFPNRFLTRKI